MEALIMTAQLLLGLSILVGLHEFGHLLTAKFFGMRVEKYSIGFPPKIFGFDYRGTEYSIGAIPLGGFVKISGMIDESMDTEHLNKEPEPYEFRAKPAWQRLIVMMGGIIVNVITGIVIFVLLTFFNGDTYISRDEANKYGIVAYELGQEIGFKTGDKILKINGKDFEDFNEVMNPDVIMEAGSTYTVDRDGQIVTVKIPTGFLDKLSDKDAVSRFIDYRLPFAVGEVASGSGGDVAGLKEGDRFVTINGRPARYFADFKEIATENAGDTVLAVVERPIGEAPVEKEGMFTTTELHIPIDTDGTVGFVRTLLVDVAHRDFTFGQSLVAGTNEAFGWVWLNIRGFGKIFSGEVSASKAVSGPIGIAKIFGGTWNWTNFWQKLGFLSMVLAFMNFLPIPALDGGHVMFLTYEIVSGRKPSDKFLENAQKVGMVLLLSIMVFAIFNDILKI
ncbi:RIP metalloprotease RseP [uncultured Imperialibacter sp.]|uniref:RIP metalloprotease RseP n=1 Tax=uncultured Imperialibacter sp. TaxID=1672639 RepID=UPI0030D776F7|tara:strand:+ start:33052 stop:34395 length:1344 start_codon:yes stop_codon:yes gene_type:complete